MCVLEPGERGKIITLLACSVDVALVIRPCGEEQEDFHKELREPIGEGSGKSPCFLSGKQRDGSRQVTLMVELEA